MVTASETMAGWLNDAKKNAGRMRVLGIETSTMLGGVAIVEDNRLVVETRLNVRTIEDS